MQLSMANQVWNRAAMESGGSKACEGDRALSALLLAHGMVMNGGVGHALEVLSLDELAAAARGYRFFGLNDVATLLEHSINANDEELERADARYAALIPTDQTLADRFEALYRATPHAFASID